MNVRDGRTGAEDRLVARPGRQLRRPGQRPERAHEAIAGSRLEIFEDVGHLPQLEAPARFVTVLQRFLDDTEPARFDRRGWRARLQSPANGEQADRAATRQVRRAQL